MAPESLIIISKAAFNIGCFGPLSSLLKESPHHATPHLTTQHTGLATWKIALLEPPP
jgi:hypothetical protein